jgi:hypothetical protein
LAWRDTNPNDSIYWEKLIKNNGSPLPSAPREMPEEKGGGPAVVDGGGGYGGGGGARAGVKNEVSGSVSPKMGYELSRKVLTPRQVVVPCKDDIYSSIPFVFGSSPALVETQ